MDAGTGLTILGTILGSKELLVKILGPTADYFGKCLENWAQKKIQNVSQILSKAKDKLGDKINEEGQVSPKVLKIILDEGSFCDDELAKEYYAGVLASSRTSTSRDDRGAYFLNLVSKLSNYQIRTHYIFYTIFKNLYTKPLGDLSLGHVRRKMRIHLPTEVYANSMDFSEQENVFEITMHSLNGLMRELLIDKDWSLGISENFSNIGGTPDLSHGIIYATSIPGLELYLWAMCNANIPINSFLLSNERMHLEKEIKIKSGAKPLIIKNAKP